MSGSCIRFTEQQWLDHQSKVRGRSQRSTNPDPHPAKKPGRTASGSVPAHSLSEEDIQIACIDYAKLLEPQYPILKRLFHPPNGGKRSKAQAGRFKAMGVKKGVPDLLLPFRHHSWSGLAIEVKDDTGRTTSEQEEWLADFKSDGYLTGVIRTLDEFVLLLNTFLGIRLRE